MEVFARYGGGVGGGVGGEWHGGKTRTVGGGLQQTLMDIRNSVNRMLGTTSSEVECGGGEHQSQAKAEMANNHGEVCARGGGGGGDGGGDGGGRGRGRGVWV